MGSLVMRDEIWHTVYGEQFKVYGERKNREPQTMNRLPYTLPR
jgi:hypothetical protein